MSEHKAEATYHGQRRAFLTGDRVRFTQLPAFNSMPGEVVEIRDSLFPYLVRLDNGYYVGADWLCLQPDPFETTGEHIFHKLGDDLYQDWADDTGEHLALHRAPRRGWVPSTGEVTMVCAIIALVIFIFVFVAVFYI